MPVQPCPAPHTKKEHMQPMQVKVGTMQKIVEFHMDESRDWVADLQCGHQHMSVTIPLDPPSLGYDAAGKA